MASSRQNGEGIDPAARLTIGSHEGAHTVSNTDAAVNHSSLGIVLCSVKIPCTLRGDTVT